MTATLTTLPQDASADDVCAAIDTDGAVILADFADSATRQALWDDLGPFFDRQPWGEDGFIGNRTRRVSSLFARTLHSAAMVTERRFDAAARHVLQRPFPLWMGEERTEIVPGIQVSCGQGIQIWPGETAQPLHRDDVLHLNRHPGPDTRVLLMFALSDFTADNGGTRVVPGSHRWDDERAPKVEEAVPTEMPAGSALVWLGSTYHGGGDNTADSPRTGLCYALDSGNVRQEENQYLAVPPETLRRYPEEIQRLLGYDIAPPFCGYVDMNDPLAAITGERRELSQVGQLYAE